MSGLTTLTGASTLDQYSIFDSEMVTVCAENYRSLRKKGITIRKTNDVIIATYCIEHPMPLLYKDRDFDPFVKYLGLVSACPTNVIQVITAFVILVFGNNSF